MVCGCTGQLIEFGAKYSEALAGVRPEGSRGLLTIVALRDLTPSAWR